MFSFVIFCIQVFLIQYAFSQRVNGPVMINNGPPVGPNVGQYAPNLGLGLATPGQVLGRKAPELSGGIAGPGMASLGPNPGLGPYSLPNSAYASAGNMIPAYGASGIPSPMYGGSGNGDVGVMGELPVAGMAAVTGQVPLAGKVAFSGNVPCGGIVTISGTCNCGCNNSPYGTAPAFNKPYGY